MSSYLDSTGLAHLISKIKAAFIPTSSVSTVTTVDLDTGKDLWVSGSSYGVIQSGSTGTAEGYLGVCVGGPNTSSGDYSFAGGYRSDVPGYGAFAFGNETRAEGNYSHAEGGYTLAYGEESHAEGASTTASGDASHTEGVSTVAKNLGEHASGRFNSSTQTSYVWGDAGNTHFSVGIGISEASRSNAIEIMQNGDVYVKGIGGYDGSYNAGATSLQSMLAGGGNLVSGDGVSMIRAISLAAYEASDKDPNTLYIVVE